MLINNGDNLRMLNPEPGTCRKTMFRLADYVGKLVVTKQAKDEMAGILMRWDLKPHTFLTPDL